MSAPLDALLTWLDQPAFLLLQVPVTWAEVLGDVTGGLCVWLLARQHILTWPLGLLNNVFWGVLFFRARLYADSVLQSLFFVFGVYGWWRWQRQQTGASDAGALVRRATVREWTAIGGLTLASTVVAAVALARFTDSPAPLADASILTMSLAATYGQAHRVLESWLVWIAVDVVSVPLYVSRGLYPTALLYVVFGVLCVQGLAEWSRVSARAGAAPHERDA